jgi:phosphatidylinositol alpha-1,6-mannosyltransferase
MTKNQETSSSPGSLGKSKSLLIVDEYFPPQVGGISKFMESIVSVLGSDVCCLTGVRKPKSPHPERGAHVRSRVYRRPYAFARWTPLQALGWSTALSEILIRERPRVVQLATVSEGYLGVWLKHRLGLPYIIYAHGNEILTATGQESDPLTRALWHADRVLAVSSYTADRLRERGVRSDRIEIMYPGCDTHHFRPVVPSAELRHRFLPGRSPAPTLLTVGNLVARKGHDMVIRALAGLRSRFPEVQYLIVGDGPNRGDLERLTTNLGLNGNVVFAGRQSDDLLPAIYSLADVFIMPSRAVLDRFDVEGFGIVFIEASACGKPVIGGRSGGVPDAIIDGETGLLVDPSDPEDIARALELLFKDEKFARRLGDQGRARAARSFTWSSFGDNLRGVLARVVRESSRTKSPVTDASSLHESTVLHPVFSDRKISPKR